MNNQMNFNGEYNRTQTLSEISTLVSDDIHHGRERETLFETYESEQVLPPCLYRQTNNVCDINFDDGNNRNITDAELYPMKPFSALHGGIPDYDWWYEGPATTVVQSQPAFNSYEMDESVQPSVGFNPSLPDLSNKDETPVINKNHLYDIIDRLLKENESMRMEHSYAHDEYTTKCAQDILTRWDEFDVIPRRNHSRQDL
jgi:hypothetical protein